MMEEYICQFLEAPDLVKIFLATNDNLYREKAEDILKCPIISFYQFIKKNNIIILEDIDIYCLSDHIYISDKDMNYIKLKGTKVSTVYINNFESFKKTWDTFHLIFAEIYLKKIKFIIKNANSFYKVNNIYLPITLNGFAIYNKNKIIHEIYNRCSNEK
jgi:hypothetical protein